jgi:RimJ/RimL family protein N-acetyltransferase
LKGNLPVKDGEGYQKYHVVYAVHEVLEPAHDGAEGADQPQTEKPTRFIGRVDLKSLGGHDLVLPEHLIIPIDEAPTTLSLELAYAFLPSDWGKGYATESIAAVFDAGKKVRSFWAPWSKVYVRVIVNEKNPPSLRVMEKTSSMVKKGVYEWKGKAVFLAGEWREEDRIVIFGKHLLE